MSEESNTTYETSAQPEPAADNTPAASTSAEAPTNTDTSTSEQPSQPQFNQDQINSAVSDLVQQQLAPYQNDLNLLSQLRTGGQQQQEPNLFEGDLGLGELPDAAKMLYHENLEMKAQMRELMAEKQQRDYNNSLESFKTNLTGILSDEKVLEAEMTAVIQNSPELAKMYTDAVQGRGSLDAKFLDTLQKEMSWRIVSSLNDPNSGILDSLVEKASRKDALRDQSMISSNQDVSGQPSANDGFSAQVTYDR
jgi:hypothetical protein